MPCSFSIVFFFVSILPVLTYITKDQGYTCQWNYNDWGQHVSQGQQFTQTINFANEFQNIPQVVVTPDVIENQISSQSAYGYLFSISEITTTRFILSLSLNYNIMYNLCFNWLALDDARFEVIHQFNVNNPVTTTFSHNNKNARAGFIFFLSFVVSNRVDFTLAVNSITETTYQVAITQTNLLKLGYTVFLGPIEALDISNLITALPLGADPRYCTDQVPLVSNKYWSFYYVQFSFSGTTPLNQAFANYSGSGYQKYCLGTWYQQFFLKFGHRQNLYSFSAYDNAQAQNLKIGVKNQNNQYKIFSQPIKYNL